MLDYLTTRDRLSILLGPPISRLIKDSTRSLGGASLIVFFLTLSGCMSVEPTHPYDANTPAELQSPASFVGLVILTNEPSNMDYEGFQIILTHLQTGDRKVAYCQSEGEFIFDRLLPGNYFMDVYGEFEERSYGFNEKEIFFEAGERLEARIPYVIRRLD